MPDSPPPPPDRSTLQEAALRHLSRYATTEAGLIRVLDRRIDRWLRATEADPATAAPFRAAARDIARTLAGAGAVDDAAFAEARARRLLRAGRSRRALAAHLAAKGVAADIAETVLPGPEDEARAAIAYLRRRRLGPFRPEPPTDETRQRDLAALARAGFSRATAETALRHDPEADQP